MFDLMFWASFVVFVPVIIALANIRYIDTAFMPLLVNLCAGVVSEILAHIFRKAFHNNLYVYNTFFLVDFLTFLWLFRNWGAFPRVRTTYLNGVVLLFVVLWILDNLVFHSLGDNNNWFRISYSLFLVMVALNQLVNVIVKNISLRYNPFLYVCLGVIFYYIYAIFISLFISSNWFHVPRPLWDRIWLIYVFFNVVCNLFFAISFLWIRKKVRFI